MKFININDKIKKVMNYKAFYRTYRPSSFDQVVGQDHIVRTLVNLIRMNKISHGYLFSGPRGTGKTSVAKIFANAINCIHSEQPEQICRLCQENSSRSLDVIEIDAASNNSVNDIRTIREQVEFGPTNSPYKVYIIDEVHMLTIAAFNALLMTLEEPPAHAIFIFATTNPDRIPDTILSRVQKYNFKRISKQVLESQLKYIFNKEQISYDESSIEMIASLANGSLRDALSIADQLNAYSNSKINIDNLIEIFGLSTIESQIQFINLLANKSASETLQYFDNLVNSGIDVSKFISSIIELLRDHLIYKNTSNSSLVSIDIKQLSKLIVSVEGAYKIIDILIPLLNEIKSSDIPYQLFQLAIIKICSFEESLIDVYSSQEINVTKPSITRPIDSFQYKDEIVKNERTTTKEQVINEAKNETEPITIKNDSVDKGYQDITSEYFGKTSPTKVNNVHNQKQDTKTVLADFSSQQIEKEFGNLMGDFSLTEEISKRKENDEKIIKTSINNIEEKLNNIKHEETQPLFTNDESESFSFKSDATYTEQIIEHTTELLNISNEYEGSGQEVNETLLRSYDTNKQTFDTNEINISSTKEISKDNLIEDNESYSFIASPQTGELAIPEEKTKEFKLEEEKEKNETKPIEIINKLNQSDIINLFILSNKETFQIFKDKLEISRTASEEMFESYVVLLKEVRFVCSSNDFILVSSEDDWVIDDIISKLNEKEFGLFVAKYFGNNVHFYAITRREYELSKLLFIDLKKSENVPQPKPLKQISYSDDNEESLKKSTSEIENKSRAIFGKLFGKKE